MKIYLYLPNRIEMFKIPAITSGSFSFDPDLDEDSKLINIEARDANWYIYTTSDVSLYYNNALVTDAPLTVNTFYILQRNRTNYLIYVAPAFDDTFRAYLYKQDINLVIGNDNSCSVKYSCKYIDKPMAKVYYKENNLILEKYGIPVYVNDKILKNPNYIIRYGDKINIYGLTIFVLNGFILVNNPGGLTNLSMAAAKLNPYGFSFGSEPKNIEIHDIDMYKKEDYFSKSPRLRRMIKTKEIKLSPPPRKDEGNKMPLILTLGPMITMGLTSVIMLVNTISKIRVGQATVKDSWPELASSGAMLLSTLFWPLVSNAFTKIIRKKQRKELIEKYTKYLDTKKEELDSEVILQKGILIENYPSIESCIQIIDVAKINFWDKRIEQNDFLDVRVGTGNVLLDVKVNYPEDGFTIEEDELKKQADKMVEEYKYINDVPVGYSFYKNKITAIMGEVNKCYNMVHNIVLQFITYYSYEDIKIVVFTNEVNSSQFEYIKYLKHAFSNDGTVRFFSEDSESSKKLNEFLYYEMQVKMSQENGSSLQPYYIIITDDYSSIKRLSFIKTLTETDDNIGFSMILVENQMSRLPSKCDNFISLGKTSSGILTNSFEEQEQLEFRDEIVYNIDMMKIARKISNIPIEFEKGAGQLPDSISFLEMEKVGKVEQLNIINRWEMNDSTQSLRAEVGVDEEGNYMYLDLHEKYHGPHGLIAGMTGSGKSEFIITYILSMAMNYSPDDVSFILIDYKGGGLAFAFENKVTGITLPHLAGVITNLDKAEMDRTLVSIDSEIKRRQKVFNEARDMLGESTIDIYKYQGFYKEGKVQEPIPHLFIICDEFAELKSQQPDFMDNLISVARIGRSLGVHLILATQKPSGVVNDQIWSNTKFRVCLKVQDESDSKEMLKRPEAASLKQTGRFYLQVGYDEYFALGQSGWCGAKYYPSERIIKQVDKSINFIDDTAEFIKSIEAGGKQIKVEAQGDQLSAIMNSIIDASKETGKVAKRLWLNNIDPIILPENLEKKYNVTIKPYKIEAIIGEYDAPEKQEQGILTYSLTKDGNTVIYGNEDVEKENLINICIYNICMHHAPNEINIYAVDYGSESLRIFRKFPQIGGVVFTGEDEKFNNLLKVIKKEIKDRKQKLIDYNGSIETYNNSSNQKLPYILVIFNNYEAILESYDQFSEDLTAIGRDCERYGIILIITCNNPTSLGRRVSSCFENSYALHINDSSDYYTIFNTKCNKLRDIPGRGFVYKDEGVHEFQTASIVPDGVKVNETINYAADKLLEICKTSAPQIPVLPEKVTFDIIKNDIKSIKDIPVGIYKNSLRVAKYDFSQLSTSIVSNKLIYINSFISSLIDILLVVPKTSIFFIDAGEVLENVANKNYNNNKVNYYKDNLNECFEKLQELEENSKYKELNFIYIIYGLENLMKKIDASKLETLITSINKNSRSSIILCDASKGFKQFEFEVWYSNIKSSADGIWIGKGLADQQMFRLSQVSKECMKSYPNNYAFYVEEGYPKLIKTIEFNDLLIGDEEDE